MLRVALFAPLVVVNGVTVPATMNAVQASGTPCSGPDWSCLTMNPNAPVPTPGSDEALIHVSSSSVNPVDLDRVEPFCVNFECASGTIGQDIAGTVVAVGDSCGFSVNDQVWAVGSGAFAEYAVAKCSQMSAKPSSLAFMPSGAIPTVGLTALQMFYQTGAPWASDKLVVIASGQGGTGYLAVQLARKVFGSSRVITAATGPGIGMVSSLGATDVVDYQHEDLFDALADNSVDVVFDNLGFPGTADKALRVLRPGGVYILLPSANGGTLSPNTKTGVTQIDFGLMQPNTADLEALAGLFDQGSLTTKNMQSFNLADTPLAFSRKSDGHVLSKITVAVSLQDTIEFVV